MSVLTLRRKNEVTEPAAKKSSRQRAKSSSSVVKADRTYEVATFGVVFMSVMSGLLNGFAHAQHAPSPVAGWLMGLAVPVIVLVLGKVAGNKWTKGQRRMAYFAGGSGVSLLAFSVFHCAEAIAILTGSSMLLAMPMALAIDCGLVSCEMAIVTEES